MPAKNPNLKAFKVLDKEASFLITIKKITIILIVCKINKIIYYQGKLYKPL